MQFMKDMPGGFKFGFDPLPGLDLDGVAGPDDAGLPGVLSDGWGPDSDDSDDGQWPDGGAGV